ncbi:transposase [Sedimentibacter hydroxybenzoicus DSM 7310]|uniref:Transposase n=1 Tax=Sedimentibacter hydroxybenzoicus DSM 7310 TaxID=1123245 RepID=A0A974BLN9_SEDHY|nr:transposase [Sedimentibacter hydroxybenzoicus]NYB74900.1 transposase [Sedimentibacter hydroxybenzoicus DSM 7310]
MPRQARVHSDTGIYHIMIRGNDKRIIFLDNEDRKRFISTLFEKASEENIRIYAYCLMNNHVHLLLHEEDDNIAILMKRINVSYVYYFNKRYKRVGHLFQDRFKSEIVDNDDYLLAVVRYIHNNPVKAGIVSSPEKYLWSSYNDYISTKKRNDLVTDKVLNLFSENISLAIKQFINFSNLDCDIKFIDFIEKEELKVEKERQAIEALNDILLPKGLCSKDLSMRENRDIRNKTVIYLKYEFDLSSRQISAIANISKGTVLKILNKNS